MTTDAQQVEELRRLRRQHRGEPEPDPGGDLHTEAASPTSDVANAHRLAAEFIDTLRWTPGLGWLAFDGACWQRDEARAVRTASGLGRLILREAQKLAAEAAGTADAGVRDRLAKLAEGLTRWARESETERRIRSALSLARSHLHVEEHGLDANPMLLNVANGTLDLRTGTLRRHSTADFITMQSPVAFDPDAKAPTWDAFLERVLPDPDVRAFVQRAIGYSLTGLTVEQIMLLLWGSGANGKTTLVEILLSLFGDYARRTPPDTLLAKRGDAIPNDVARLRGARFVSAVETDEGRRLSEARVKELTGSDTMSARFMRAEWFDFRPVCKLWLATNHRPQVRGTDEAIWRRIRLIPFDQFIPPEERDLTLRDRLERELPGVLAWAVRGCLEWQRHGLGAPAAVLAATNAYRAEEDVLGAFIADLCVMGDPAVTWVSASELYTAYAEWSRAAGEHPLSQKRFGTGIRDRGFARERRGAGRRWAWIGLGLAADVGHG